LLAEGSDSPQGPRTRLVPRTSRLLYKLRLQGDLGTGEGL
jgi:hypothetical protein